MKILERIKVLFEESKNTATKNPVIPVLSRNTSRSDIELPAARLGFALKVIHADSQVSAEEKSMLVELVRKYLDESSEKAALIAEELLKIEDVDLEMMYFARVMNEKLSEQERQDFLSDLFRVAKADNEYAMIEERDLRVISRYLLLSHPMFVQTRNRVI